MVITCNPAQTNNITFQIKCFYSLVRTPNNAVVLVRIQHLCFDVILQSVV